MGPLDVVALVVALLTALPVPSMGATTGGVGGWVPGRPRRLLGR